MLATAALAAWLVAPAPEPRPTAAIVVGDPTPWPLAPGEVRRHTVTLEAGQFMRVTLKQEGIDVTARLHAPDGTTGDLVDANEGPRGWEPASLLASTRGAYVLEVAAAPTAPEAGHYVVDAEEPRPVEPRDRRLLIAEAARARAGPGLGPRAIYAKRLLSAVATQETLKQLPLAAGIFRGLGETCWEADSLTFQGLLLGWDSEGLRSIETHTRALALWEKCGDRYRHAEAHNYAAEGYVQAGQYARAAEVYERGLALAREEGARDIELLLLNNAGGAYGLLGETDKALRHGEEALAAFRARDLVLLQEIALQNLARAHLRRGELQQAAGRAAESLACARRIDDTVGEVLVTGTLAEIYMALGEPAEARRVMTAILPRDSDPLTAAQYQPFFPLLVRTYEEVDPGMALEFLERRLVRDQYQARPGEVAGLLALAAIHLRRGDPEAAHEAAYQASELLRGSGNRYDLASALGLIGSASVGLADVAGARRAFDESLAIQRDIRNGQGQAMALHGLARADRLGGDLASARSRLEEALRLIEGERARITSPDLRSAWLANLRSIHEEHVQTLMDLGRRDPGAGWEVKAFEASEAAHARSLLDLLAESRDGFRQGADPALLERERMLRERLGARLEMQVRLLASSGAPAARDDVAREIQALSAEYEDVRGRLRAASPRYAALTRSEPLGLERVREEVLDPGTLLLEYTLGAERSYLWVVGSDRFDVHELPAEAAIGPSVRRARAQVSRRPEPGTDKDALAALSALLLGPARARLGSQRLVFVADGLLHHVPFGALLDGNGLPLVASHEVVSAPSASVVALLRATGELRRRPTRTVAVLADPVFDRSDARVGAPTVASAGIDSTLQRATRDFGFEDGRLPRLLFTRREARSIMALAPTGRLALDFQASRSAVQAPDLKEYRYLHFATHGLLNDVRPELSGLVLSLVDRDGRDVPGLLTAPDVFNLELGAELVVLSGCRTALGKEVRGEGLIGLTRAFMYAGVPRVVASLWPVDDLTTAELMKRFYEGMLGPRQLRPASALRRAQAHMARDPRWSAPYYWAGFQLQGDWR